MLGARSGPRMEEDPLGPRHRVAGNLVGYKHGMMGQGDGAGKGVWLGPHNGPTGKGVHGTLGTGRCRDGTKGNRTWDGQGDQKRQATALWDWETCRHGVVNHWPTMGNLNTGSRENALNTGTDVRCPQG